MADGLQGRNLGTIGATTKDIAETVALLHQNSCLSNSAFTKGSDRQSQAARDVPAPKPTASAALTGNGSTTRTAVVRGIGSGAAERRILQAARRSELGPSRSTHAVRLP